MFPCDKEHAHVGTSVWGRMPSGEIREFKTEFGYHQAYNAEMDEFNSEIDRLAELSERMFPDMPEDFYPGYGVAYANHR